MNSVFISGIPTAGKSYLAKKLSKITGLSHIDIDKFRKEMKKDPKLKKWVNFYWNLDEEKYYTETSCDDQWLNLVNQSEIFWPTVTEKLNKLLEEGPIVVEGVNLLPHLVVKDFNFKGVFLLGESEKIVLERLKKGARWGKTINLKKLEADAFFNCEGKRYKNEAEKYGYKTFRNSTKAEKELLGIIHG